MKKKLRVYIASPYTNGDTAINVKLQMTIANILMNEGFVPFVPLYSHFQHMVYPRQYQDWIDMDFAWIEACDLLVRFHPRDEKGNIITSKGADEEVKYAKKIGIATFEFDSMEVFEDWAIKKI